MILAGIDIGTNTLRLLVAETGPNSFRELYSDRKITRLGQDLDRTGRLSPDAGKRSLNALLDFAESIRRHAALHVAAVGTSALRNASNSLEYIAEVKSKTNLSISIITGEEEARLTLLGVAQALKEHGSRKADPLESALVVDIGGGSTELIVTRPKQPPFVTSLPLGAVYLTERFIKHDPPLPEEMESMRRMVRETLDRQCAGIQPGTDAVFVGTAGTITTLASIDQCLAVYDPDKINGHRMAKETIDGIVRKLTASTLKERRAIPGLEHGREDIILSGAVITQEIMDRFGFAMMVVSDWGLREGVVLDLYEKISKGI